MELSIVIPIYHSAKNAIQHLPNIIKVLRGKYKNFEIIFVIDNDHIEKEVKTLFQIQDEYNEIRVHQLIKNHGQHFATLCGYYLAYGDYIACVDEDMTHYISSFCETDDYISSDVFYLHYDKNNMYTSRTRKYLSNLFKYLINKLVYLDKHSTFRVISKSTRNKILQDKHIFWNLDIMIYEYAEIIKSTEIKDCEVKDYESGYNYTKLCKVAFEMAYEHNTIFMNLILAVFPAFIYFSFKQDIIQSFMVYLILVFLITILFLAFKILTPSTKEKILQAIKY